MSAKYIFITAYIDHELYHRCVTDNPFIIDNPEIKTVGYDNTKENKFVSTRYNQFIDSWDYDDEAWFIFCHSDWEVLEDITKKLRRLDKNAFYGPIGTIAKERRKKLVHEYRGYCRERTRDGSESRILSCKKKRTGTLVDTLDAQCLVIHSSLIKKYGLRFDEKYEFDLYSEDLSVSAKLKHGVKTRILRVECRHNNIAKNMDGRDNYYRMLDIFNKKFPDNTFGSTVTVLGKVDKPVEHIFPRFLEEKET